MSRRLTTEDIQVRFIINGNSAKRELGELDSKAAQLRSEMKGLKRNTEEWIAKNSELTKIRQRQDELRQSIGLTGLTMKQLYQRAAELRRIKDHLTPGTEQFKKLDRELTQVNARLKQLKYGSQASGFSVKKLASGFNQYAAMGTAAVAAVAGVVLSVKSLIDGNAKLSDSLADVRKTTGLTEAGVKELSKSFKNIDTRSSRRELLDLARIAGKLGVEGQQNIYGFVKSADQINVALSEDLGGNVEETIRQVGKLVDIFKVKDEFGLEDGLLKVGSAINALGASSTANEQYLVEFAKRFGGIAPNAGMTIQDVLGLAATLDQLGQTSEVSTTVLGKLFVLLGRDVEKFAEMTDMSVDDFRKLLEEDANEAMIRVLESAKSTKGGLEGMAESLESLGVDGQRSVGVIGVLSNNIGILREQQKLSNEEFKKGTSLTEEFNVKNNNLAANIEKLGKKIRSAFISSTLLDWLNKAVMGISKWMEIPLSEQLEEEGVQVGILATKLADSNIPLKDRQTILNELKTINPDIVKGLEAENLNYELLIENIQRYNEELINRIVLQKKQEEIDEAAKLRSETEQELGLNKLNMLKYLNKAVLEYQKIDNELGLEANRIARNINLSYEERVSRIASLKKAYKEKIADENKSLKVMKDADKAVLELWRSTSLYIKGLIELGDAERNVLDLQEEKQKLSEQLFGEQKRNLWVSRQVWNEYLAEQERTVEQQIELLEKIYQQGEVSLEFRDEKMKELNLLLKNSVDETGDEITESIKDKRNKWGQTYDEWLEEMKQRRIQQELDSFSKDWINKLMDEKQPEEPPLPQMEEELNEDDESEYLIEVFKQTIDGRRALLEAHYIAGITSHAEYIDQKKALDQEYEETVKASNERIRQAVVGGLLVFSDAFGALKEFYNESSESFKAMAIAQTVLSTFAAAVEAYKSTAAIPIVGPALAPIAAATALAFGLRQITQMEDQDVSQYYEGKYPVIGRKDRRRYQADYMGESQTGMVYSPGLFLAGEREPEMIISGPDLKDPMIANYAQAIQDIKFGRSQSTGSVTVIREKETKQVIEKTYSDPKLLNALDRLNENLEKGITGKWVYSEFEEIRDMVETIREDISG
jgi:TP901 family phage tail tape measure protein